jgi:hypothetical protein
MAADLWDFSSDAADAPAARPGFSITTGGKFDFGTERPAPTIPSVREDPRPYTPAVVADLTRLFMQKVLGLGVIALLFTTVGLVFTLIFITKISPSEKKDLAVTVFSAVVGITGTVLGFYFGTSGASTNRT